MRVREVNFEKSTRTPNSCRNGSSKEIAWLQGCDDDSFVQNYLEKVLGFQTEKIKIIDHENDYPTEFERNNIAAAFLELPYEKVFLNKYCERYTSTEGTFRFGGFGFVGTAFALHFYFFTF
ncbi:hypothetical protein POTOM_015164 [Populus tomentosa]|uniref:Uncharacterized protein n=1 Tax=Populus tomentosa TaxID=118781 RepID=A0A8X7ZZK7_POPTO|nr:hypothetical protein POTOM_015164 [Populus tomentosa]